MFLSPEYKITCISQMLLAVCRFCKVSNAPLGGRVESKITLQRETYSSHGVYASGFFGWECFCLILTLYFMAKITAGSLYECVHFLFEFHII